ncbi:hypothetical protein [Carboxylicivirga sp. RSCT41]|uniref:hypothetical protein n=1 Tax=Carboxylicivirga agarovorans TaxID=3417570 RepID=UPI003D34175E
MKKIQAITFEGGQKSVSYDHNPSSCPFCHQSITPRTYQAFNKSSILEITFICPNPKCGRAFFAIYKNGYSSIGKNPSTFYYVNSSIGNVEGREFSNNITKISSLFTEIYNQSLESESIGLNHIAGIGYRKALEFLIKDYLISLNPDDSNTIKSKFLGNCIKDYIDNKNLKSVAERAVWLGNDETHYVRKWEDKDIKDLKKLIDLTLHWIEMEILTEQYSSEMTK